MKKELNTPDVLAIVLLFCAAYLCQLRAWAWLCGVAGWEPGKLWIYLGAAALAAKYAAWTNNTARDWWEEWRAKR